MKDQRRYDQGFQDACRIRWELDARQAFMQGFRAGYKDTVMAADVHGNDITKVAADAWNNYQQRRAQK